jgi:hypothetical protein
MTAGIDWLSPPGSIPSFDLPAVTWPAGVLWDAVRTPYDLAQPALNYLLGNAYERRRLGPVLHDVAAGQFYWLVTRGHSAAYPPDCRLIGRGGWVSAPTVPPPGFRLQWLHLPSTPRLSGPPWLAAALQHQHALNQTTLTTETP